MRPRTVLLLAVLACALHSHAQVLGTPKAPDAGITPQPGAELPLDIAVTDSDGRSGHLGDFFGDSRPVLLVLGYYRCPQLCGLVMHGVLESLHQSHVARDAVRIVGVSIDPQDTPATARSRLDADLGYARFLAQADGHAAPPDVHLLVADATAIGKLARRAGFKYSTAEGGDARFAHPAAVIVATPRGRISNYLMGIRFDAGDLRRAMADASGSRVGSVGNAIALLCAHVDPSWGRHSAAILESFRVAGVLGAFALGAWCWRRRSPARQEAPR
jgi:protein SCO1/2